MQKLWSESHREYVDYEHLPGNENMSSKNRSTIIYSAYPRRLEIITALTEYFRLFYFKPLYIENIWMNQTLNVGHKKKSYYHRVRHYVSSKPPPSCKACWREYNVSANSAERHQKHCHLKQDARAGPENNAELRSIWRDWQEYIRNVLQRLTGATFIWDCYQCGYTT